MNYFRATSDKQLGICLKMLYAEGIQGDVQVVKNSKGKIEFHIYIEEQEKIEMLKTRYESLIL